MHDVIAGCSRHFTDSDDLALTAGSYAMVPRVLDALRLPVESDTPYAPVGVAH